MSKAGGEGDGGRKRSGRATKANVSVDTSQKGRPEPHEGLLAWIDRWDKTTSAAMYVPH